MVIQFVHLSLFSFSKSSDNVTPPLCGQTVCPLFLGVFGGLLSGRIVCPLCPVFFLSPVTGRPVFRVVLQFVHQSLCFLGGGSVWSYSLPTLSCVFPMTSDKSSRVLCGPTVCPPVTLPLGLCFVWSFSLPTCTFVLPSKSSDKFCFFVCLPTWGVGGVQYNMSRYTLNVVGV